MNFSFFGIAFICIIASVSAIYIRGVPKNKQDLYTRGLDDPETFECLDKLKVIPFYQVNDDYCDCPDGSDEPAACPNFHFYCQNRGYISNYIPSSNVNDGICDCCDGSDESTTIICANKCQELANQYLQQSENEKRNYDMGIHERTKYEQEGKAMLENLKSEVSQLQTELETLKSDLPSIKENKENMEKLEEEEKKNVMNSPEWSEKHNELIKKLKISEMTVEQLQELIIELGKKYFLAKDIQEISKKMLNDNETAVEEINFDDYLPPNTYTKPEANEARNKLQEAEKRITDLESQIKEKNNNLNLKGIMEEDVAWYYIKGKCYDGRSGKYNYRHCLLDSVTQDGTNLGTFDHMEEIDEKKKKILYYKNGSSCWNGPNRSCKVTLECGFENRVIDVSEPSTCVYEMKFESPLGCNPDKPSYFDPNLCEDGCEL